MISLIENYCSHILTATLFMVIIYLANDLRKRYRILKMVSKFDGPKMDSFIMGHAKIFKLSSDKLRLRTKGFAEEFYPHYQIRILHEIGLVIFSPEDVELILSTKKHSTKGDNYAVFKRWLVDGLLISKGLKWTQRRKLITPAFHFSILKQFLAIFNEETDRLVENIKNHLSVDIDISSLVSEFTLYAMIETSMGIKLDTKDADQAKYRDAVYATGAMFLKKLRNPLYYIPGLTYFLPLYWEETSLLRTLHGFTRRIIHNRIKNFKGFPVNFGEDKNDKSLSYRKERRLAMLDILLQAKHEGEHIDYEGICEEVDTFMFEGHDTTAASLNFTLMLLGSHPIIQEQIHHEIKSILGDELKRPTFNDLQEMQLLERCIKESLRLYPSVPSISRLIDEDVVLNSGKTMPKGARIHISILDLHMNPKIYPDPNKFDPDRFLPENCHNRHPYAYIPFSAGPRNCIGQKFALLEIKTLLVGIIQRFKFTSNDTPDTIKLKPEIILRTVDPIKIQFTPRNKEGQRC